jgi:Type II CAAX prenyl endopeptidase Rce1-like
MYEDRGRFLVLRPRASGGWWTCFGTWAILLAFAIGTGGLRVFLRSLGDLLSGRLAAAGSVAHDYGRLFPYAAGAVVVCLPIGVGLGLLVNVIKGMPFVPHNVFRSFWPSKDLLTIMAVLVGEELYARWLFVGLLPNLPFLRGDVARYALILIGNLSWALLHRWNLTDPEDRSLLRVLPQFAIGIVFTLAYLNFGLLGALLVHAAYDMLLFCVDRWSDFGVHNIVLAGLAAGVGALAWVLLRESPGDALQWLHATGSYALPGWKTRDYFCAVFLAVAMLTIVGELLRFDHAGSIDSGSNRFGPFPVAILKALVLLAVFRLVGLFEHDLVPRVIVASLVLLTFSARSSTGSGVARVFWLRTPAYAVALCSLLAMPFWVGVVLLALLELAYNLEDLVGSLGAPV